jgi:acylphosphatase
MSPSDEPVGVLVRYTGRVQGVGFRATAAGIAELFPVTGYVRNCPDLSVELLAEGPESAVGRFLAAVRARFDRHIHTETPTPVPPTGRYTSFDVVG